jgi:hypothetical protein
VRGHQEELKDRWAASAEDEVSGIIYHLTCPRRVRMKGFIKYREDQQQNAQSSEADETQDTGTEPIETLIAFLWLNH